MMMQGIRKAGQGLFGKIVIAIMFSFLIISFAIWGVGDIFRGYGRNEVAKVGKTEIGLEQMRTAYQNEIQNLIRQQRRQISPEMARALGLDRQVLSRLLTEATLDQTAQGMRLAVSDETIRNLIFDDQVFRDASGQFSSARFNELLRSNGYTEQSYVALQRSTILRQQLSEMVVGGLSAPLALQEVGNRLRNEKRAITFARMPASAAGEIAAPTEDQLKSFFNDRKAAFRAPEFRTANILAITAETLADPAKITDDEAKARYEATKAQRFTAVETRTVQQIPFPSEEEAQAAKAKIDGGETFDEIATERNVAFNDLTLGTFTRDQMIDPAVRDAVFAIEEGGVTAPVKGAFGTVLLRVTKVEGAHVRPLEEVIVEVKQELATSRAAAQVTDLHDKIEDQRASARPLAEIAKELNLTLRTAGPMNAGLGRPDGSREEALPGGDPTLQAIFRSDIGVDNEAIRLPRNAGYVWFDVTKIDPARERAFDEVKAEVEKQWRADESATRLSAKARELIERLDKGENFDAVAASTNLTIETAADLGRQDQRPELPGTVIAQVFGIAVGKSGSAATPDGGRILFKVDSATVAPYVRTTQEAGNFERLLSSSVSEDIMLQYVAKRQAELGVSINEAAFRNATGGAQN
ncbi:MULTISPECIES: peptidylprolyl isomerase [Bosea]|uniref:peptidylprolyl isomerase n=1 Tax=Bosea TaxID=85413 RepID=UPI00214FDC2C|nr:MULTISPECIES: peptidylprolyl isomerase [Bosea]MCR4521741.1 SurA N-terminal domain-containing protein [Bosea sp. 47.2.35]MDR6827263.1 peptidyl-prolyl cis-trans isomerase D [Bosea robiniae]MDR6893973.1 peptidyl-prolyl cis-trans isomerase D [Bosea sp. BE109]MDR7137368.1 peptidyl-prolyl cis-trans isomerase D [Bosea sp. BE168]MDR7174068.1 peptidyl-prolyl cis-trans isomerase D [Bosea sp. BE271]